MRAKCFKIDTEESINLGEEVAQAQRQIDEIQKRYRIYEIHFANWGAGSMPRLLAYAIPGAAPRGRRIQLAGVPSGFADFGNEVKVTNAAIEEMVGRPWKVLLMPTPLMGDIPHQVFVNWV